MMAIKGKKRAREPRFEAEQPLSPAPPDADRPDDSTDDENCHIDFGILDHQDSPRTPHQGKEMVLHEMSKERS
jgi:hypothetical protein